jgi:hypothetical protein
MCQLFVGYAVRTLPQTKQNNFRQRDGTHSAIAPASMQSSVPLLLNLWR